MEEFPKVITCLKNGGTATRQAWMSEDKEIMMQIPQVEETACEGQVTGYVAYLNLDWLREVFGSESYNREEQEKYIDTLVQGFADILLHHKHGVALSWSWYTEEGDLRRAIELLPVSSGVQGLKVVTPDVTGYEDLKKENDELHKELTELQAWKHKVEHKLEWLKARMED